MHTPFDHRRSLALDRIIAALEANPSALRRFWLARRKRHLERKIPLTARPTAAAAGRFALGGPQPAPAIALLATLCPPSADQREVC